MRGKRLLVLAVVSGPLALIATPAAASLTMGQTAQSTTNCLALNADFIQPTVIAGNSYVVPGAGTITSWTVNQGPTAGQMLKMKVFRKVDNPATYRVVGHDGPATLTPNGTGGNTFASSIRVQGGDVLGLHTVTDHATCLFSAPGEQFLLANPSDLGDGASGPFSVDSADQSRLNIQATFVPDNTFTLGAVTRNKKKGTATITAQVPDPGELTGSGKGLKVASAVISKTVNAPGAVTLTVKAKGKQKQTLDATGKVKLKPKITYTPTGGSPSSQSLKVKLIKR